jgi:1,4-alpha-glucan branching enzyme
MNKPVMWDILPKILLAILMLGGGILLWSCSIKKVKRPSSIVVHPEWSRPANIYEVNIRQFTPEGTFAAFEKHLPRLKAMGVDILWLMPINPIGIKNRKGTLGSYYSVRDYLAVNPEFGTLDDLKHLVRQAHELGMHVIIDWVANHTSWDNPLITEHPDWYTHDSAGNIISPVPDWTDAADLDYSQPGMREYMTHALEYWVREADIDGYRCDVAGMLPVDFWNKAVPEIKKIKHVFMLAEWETPEMHDTAFDMTYSWNLYHLMNAIARGEKPASQLDTLWKKEDTLYAADAYRMLFTSNHDENSWNGTEYERLGEGARTFAVLTYTAPGMPMVYSGQEAAFNRRLKFFDKDTIQWDNYPLLSFYTTLNQLKKDHPALWNGVSGGKLEKIQTGNDDKLYAFTRKKDQDQVMVILNLSPGMQTIRLAGHSFLGNFKNVFTGEVKRFEDEEAFSMKPWEYLVFVRQ